MSLDSKTIAEIKAIVEQDFSDSKSLLYIKYWEMLKERQFSGCGSCTASLYMELKLAMLDFK